MASLIPGFEYDIFISYRQKDNKYDGWVTEFVDNLKKELEATFKEEVSVYFDINPQDGLLETHDVDASLKEKLRSLIFIPILSRTFCDPKSFAWEHEFKPFIEQASNDNYGLRVKLHGGNVANRVLPVRIHDLNIADVSLFESEIGGVLRGVDFIYKSPGVNRPLRANEDHPQDNLNKTYYRDQVNKVANAIEEIISSLAIDQPVSGKEKTRILEPEKEINKRDKRKELIKKGKISQKSKKILLMVLSVFLFVAGTYAIYMILRGNNKTDDFSKLEKSIAVLPFINDSPDQENTYFVNGLMDEILNDLQKVKAFRVLSRRTVEQYRSQIKSIPEIAKELNVNYLVEGSAQKYGNILRLRVQLITATNERHLWADSFEQEIKETRDIFRIQSQIAQSIAAELKATITPEEKEMIDLPSTINLTAYDFYQRGNEELNKYYLSGNTSDQAIKNAEKMFYKALEYDSTLANAYTGLAEIYCDRNYGNLSYFSENYLDSVLLFANRAISYNDHLPEAYFWRCKYYYFRGEFDKSINELEKSLKDRPKWDELYWNNGYMLYILGLDNADYVKGLQYMYKGLSLAPGTVRPGVLGMLAETYQWIGFPEKSKWCNDEASKLINEPASSNPPASPDNEVVIESLKKSYAKDSSNADTVWKIVETYSDLGQYKMALKYVEKFLKLADNQKKELRNVHWGIIGEFNQSINYYMGIGNVYLKNGLRDEAYKWFEQEKRDLEESLKLGRFLGSVTYFHLADLEAYMGDKAGAYRNLKMLARVNVWPLWLLNYLKEDGQSFRDMRNETEFREILKEMEAKYNAEHERVRKWLEEQGKLD
jgi:TolB-like protein